MIDYSFLFFGPVLRLLCRGWPADQGESEFMLCKNPIITEGIYSAFYN